MKTTVSQSRYFDFVTVKDGAVGVSMNIACGDSIECLTFYRDGKACSDMDDDDQDRLIEAAFAARDAFYAERDAA